MVDFPKLPGGPPGLGGNGPPGLNGNGPPGLPGPGDGPDLDLPGPDLRMGNGPGLSQTPPGLSGRDVLPPGVARQLEGSLPPAPPTPTPPGGSPPATNSAPVTQSLPATPASLPAPPQAQGQPPPHSSSPLAQVVQTVQTLATQVANAFAGNVNNAAQANPALANQAATANPIVNTAATAATAQTANAVALPGAVPTQAAVAAGQPVGAGTVTVTAAPPTANVNPAAQLARSAAPDVPVPPARAEAAATQRPDASLLDRLMSLLRPGAAANTAASGTTTAANAAGTTAQAAAAASAAVALPLAVPASQAATDARGHVLLAVNDRAALQRADGPLTGVYTADGPGRRALRRGAKVLPARLSRWLIAMGLGGAVISARERDPEFEIAAAFQWMFWLLVVIAYGCLGFALIAFLPIGSEVFGSSGRGWTGGLAVFGLFAAAGAWWLGRRLAGRTAADDTAARRDDARR